MKDVSPAAVRNSVAGPVLLEIVRFLLADWRAWQDRGRMTWSIDYSGAGFDAGALVAHAVTAAECNAREALALAILAANGRDVRFDELDKLTTPAVLRLDGELLIVAGNDEDSLDRARVITVADPSPPDDDGSLPYSAVAEDFANLAEALAARD